MFIPTEILIMAVSILGLPLLRVALRPGEMHGGGLFVAGYCTALGANLSTVLEGVCLEYWFNALEHLLTTGSGILFALAIYRFISTPHKTRAAAGDTP